MLGSPLMLMSLIATLCCNCVPARLDLGLVPATTGRKRRRQKLPLAGVLVCSECRHHAAETLATALFVAHCSSLARFPPSLEIPRLAVLIYGDDSLSR